MRRGLKEDLAKAFEEMREEFPFPGYVDRKLGKYFAVATRIMERYPPGSRILSIGCGPCDLESVLAKLGYSVTGIDDLKDQRHLREKSRTRCWWSQQGKRKESELGFPQPSADVTNDTTCTFRIEPGNLVGSNPTESALILGKDHMEGEAIYAREDDTITSQGHRKSS